LHDLLDRVTADEQLDPRRKADVRSATKSLAQWLGSDDPRPGPKRRPLPGKAEIAAVNVTMNTKNGSSPAQDRRRAWPQGRQRRVRGN
jgi:hypothetical protein